MPSDEALFEQLQAGEMAAFDLLYRRYERPLFGFIRHYTTDAAEAEEIFHDAFMALLDAREGRALESFRAWIYRVARNRCLKRLRKRSRHARAIEKVRALPASVAPDPETSHLHGETAAALAQALERLPPHLAEVYALRARGMSYEESAQVLGIPIGTVRSRIHAMIGRLREEMATCRAK